MLNQIYDENMFIVNFQLTGNLITYSRNFLILEDYLGNTLSYLWNVCFFFYLIAFVYNNFALRRHIAENFFFKNVKIENELKEALRAMMVNDRRGGFGEDLREKNSGVAVMRRKGYSGSSRKRGKRGGVRPRRSHEEDSSAISDANSIHLISKAVEPADISCEISKELHHDRHHDHDDENIDELKYDQFKQDEQSMKSESDCESIEITNKSNNNNAEDDKNIQNIQNIHSSNIEMSSLQKPILNDYLKHNQQTIEIIQTSKSTNNQNKIIQNKSNLEDHSRISKNKTNFYFFEYLYDVIKNCGCCKVSKNEKIKLLQSSDAYFDYYTDINFYLKTMQEFEFLKAIVLTKEKRQFLKNFRPFLKKNYYLDYSVKRRKLYSRKIKYKDIKEMKKTMLNPNNNNIENEANYLSKLI